MSNKNPETSNPVLEDAQYVNQLSEDVSIDNNKVTEFVKTNQKKLIAFQNFESPVFDVSNIEMQERLNLLLAFDSINFSYWGEPKWHFNSGLTKVGGSIGLFAALKEARMQITDAKLLSTLREERFKEILSPDSIPLFKERLLILRDVGKILIEKYEGEFKNFVDKQNDCLRFLEQLVKDFPSFSDSSIYKSKHVRFLKRAQLVVWDISQTKEYGERNLNNTDKLTAFADYKIPFILRKLGVLKYSDALTMKVDKGIQILPNSSEEVEIRANTIVAVDTIRSKLQKNYGVEILSPKIDDSVGVKPE